MNNNYKRNSIIISSINIINILFLLLISLGIFDITSNNFFSIYFICSYTLIPLFLILLQILQIYKYREEGMKDKLFTKIPFLASIIYMLLFGIKMMIVLDKSSIIWLIIITFAFVALEILLMLLFFKKIKTFKKQIIMYILSFLLFEGFMASMIIMSYFY